MSFFPFFRRAGCQPAGPRSTFARQARLSVESLDGRNPPSSLSGTDMSDDFLPDDTPVMVSSTDQTQDNSGPGGGGDGGRHHDDDDAATATTTQFTSIAGGSFIDLPPSSFLTPVSAGGVTITASNDADGSFFNFPAGTPDAPGSGNGFLDFNHDLFNTSPLTLNFSQPLTAFGVSFEHFPSDRSGGNFTAPAVLKVFDGADGTGNLLGTVTSSGFVPTGNPIGQQSFVAVLSSHADIRSAVLVGTDATLSFAVDGYAVSTAPQAVVGDH